MKRMNIFEADDGTRWETRAECKAHEEREKLEILLSNLTIMDVQYALDRERLDLADAFERAGNIVAAKRRDSGELRRKKGQEGAGTFAGVVKAMSHKNG